MKRSSRKYCEKKDTRFEMRLSYNEKLLLTYHAHRYNCSVSRYVYLLISNAITPYQNMILAGDATYEDFLTDSDDFLQQ